MIRNIIFDMGNVLLHFDREAFLDAVDVHGADRELLLRQVYLSLEWSQMDRGSLTEAEAAERMCRRVPPRLWDKVHLLVDQWDRPILPMAGMEELVRELKEKGYRIYLLSNASLRQHEYWPRVPGSEYFDGTVVSADLHLVKPQPEIYLYTLCRFGLKAEECVFIDDATLNVEGAVSCGLSGIVYHGDTEELRTELRSLGVNA